MKIKIKKRINQLLSMLMTRNLVSMLTRLTISIFLMWYLLSKIKFAEIIKIILNANILYVLICLLLSLFASFLLIYRWSVLLRLFFQKIRFPELMNLYWKSQFVSLFVPSTLGGDLFRMYKISKHHGEPEQVMIAGITDRLLGLCAIVLLTTFALVLGRSAFDMKTLEYFKYFLSLLSQR